MRQSQLTCQHKAHCVRSSSSFSSSSVYTEYVNVNFFSLFCNLSLCTMTISLISTTCVILTIAELMIGFKKIGFSKKKYTYKRYAIQLMELTILYVKKVINSSQTLISAIFSVKRVKINKPYKKYSCQNIHRSRMSLSFIAIIKILFHEQ